MKNFDDILHSGNYDKNSILRMLNVEGGDFQKLISKASDVREKYIGKKVWFRGLVEFPNICNKDCFYCGIRRSISVNRYKLTDEEILSAARFAYESHYGSIVLQAGEIQTPAFTERITGLVRSIKKLSDNKLGITLSLGEQSGETYKEWFDAGAHRYLLPIETSNPALYKKLHPDDGKHSFTTRLDCLRSLKQTGYQTGTGVMIGLPFQTTEDLADDILFFLKEDIHMVGMGPYIEHRHTPLYNYRQEIPTLRERFLLALKMIAILRLTMKDINIAAATSLQAIDPMGREKGVMAGANIIMPNITPGKFRNDYSLYENKPCVDEEPEECLGCLDAKLSITGHEIMYGEWGNSKRFR